jgi:hypothetical protein
MGIDFRIRITRIVPLTALMAGMAVTFLIENKNSWDLREKTALVILLVFVIGIPYGLLGKKRNQSLSVSFKPDVYKDFGKWLTQQFLMMDFCSSTETLTLNCTSIQTAGRRHDL